MPFLSCKFSLLKPNVVFYHIEKKGKTLHLLKASAKMINPNKRRKLIPLMGTIKQYQEGMETFQSETASVLNMSQSQQN